MFSDWDVFDLICPPDKLKHVNYSPVSEEGDSNDGFMRQPIPLSKIRKMT